jgi:hypothetical protein
MINALGRRGARMLLIATAMLAGAAGIALATIPGSDGVIDGCYEKRTGILRVIDAQAGKTCLSFETPIRWNQGGPAGPAGEKGPMGAKGPTGDKGPNGDQGLQGEKGPVGDRGVAGTQGAAGDKGPQGDAGDKGPAGDKGLPGDKGPQGDPGPEGGGIADWTLTREQSPHDSNSKDVAAVCPAGTRIVGGGYTVIAGDSAIIVGLNAPSTDGIAWRVRAHELTPTDNQWNVVVSAICAR